MSTTIFCNFEQQDMADLAVGRLRASSLAIRSIHYIGGFRPERERRSAASAAAIGFAGAVNTTTSQSPAAVFGIADIEGPAEAPMPSPPVTLKIVCADSAAAAVKAKLINMNAYRIITTR